MAYREQIEALIGPLKRAAIDASMPTGLFCTRTDTSYQITYPSEKPHMDWITRPDANGEGGGDWSTSAPFVPGSLNAQMDARYKEQFDTIRATIDELMFPFLRLAEPSKCDTHIENARTACKSLSCSPSVGEDKTPTGASEITEQLAGIAQALDKMSGETIAAFKQKFLLKLNRTIASLHGASVACSSTLKAEQEIFDKANKAVIEAVTSATAAFIASSDNTAAEIKVTLKILGFAVTAAKAFTGDGVGVGLDLAELGIDIGESAAGGEDFAMDTNGDYESVLSTFQQSLEAIKKDILDSETFIQGYLDKCSTQIDTDHESYDLTVPPINSTDVDAGRVVIMDQNLVKEIYHNYLPTISADLTTAADDLNKLKMEVRRHSGIGVGSNGPSPEFTVLLYKIWTAVKDLATDVDRGAANLEAAAADFATNDEKTAALLDETAGQVQAPTGYDRWPDS